MNKNEHVGGDGIIFFVSLWFLLGMLCSIGLGVLSNWFNITVFFILLPITFPLAMLTILTFSYLSILTFSYLSYISKLLNKEA